MIKIKGIPDGRGSERLHFFGSGWIANLAVNCRSAAARGGVARENILISNIQLFPQKT
jgi:hypothetical protein